MKQQATTLLALGLALSLATATADAGPRERAAKAKATSGSYTRQVERSREGATAGKDITGTTGDGRSWERHIDTTKTESGYTRTDTFSGPNGGTATKDVVVTRNEDGTVTKTVTFDRTPPQNGDNAADPAE